MKTVIVFGAGGTGRKIRSMIKDSFSVVCFVDNSEEKWNTTVEGLPVYQPTQLSSMTFDYIIIGTLTGLNDTRVQLLNMGIPEYKINTDLVLVWIKSREFFLQRFSQQIYDKNLTGNVAEAGVFRGAFARVINSCFPDRELYLFDTFDGFDSTDIENESRPSLVEAEYLRDTSVSEVLEIMPFPGMCHVIKGLFPQTAVGIESEFCFVNLDMDLYAPTIGGLQFFYPKMVPGGIILIHDYFSDAYPNVKQAVAEYETQIGYPLKCTPIGDDISLAILK